MMEREPEEGRKKFKGKCILLENVSIFLSVLYNCQCSGLDFLAVKADNIPYLRSIFADISLQFVNLMNLTPSDILNAIFAASYQDSHLDLTLEYKEKKRLNLQ